MKLGSKLNELCKEKGLSISALAKKSGVPTQTIHGWTVGRKSVNPEQLRKVAMVLKVSIYQLLFDEVDPHEPIGQEVLKELFSGDIRVTLHKIERK